MNDDMPDSILEEQIERWKERRALEVKDESSN